MIDNDFLKLENTFFDHNVDQQRPKIAFASFLTEFLTMIFVDTFCWGYYQKNLPEVSKSVFQLFIEPPKSASVKLNNP